METVVLKTSQIDILAKKFSDNVNDIIRDSIREVLMEIFDMPLNKYDVAQLIGTSLDALEKRCQRGLIPYHKRTDGGKSFLRKEIKEYLLPNIITESQMANKSSRTALPGKVVQFENLIHFDDCTQNPRQK